MTTTVEVAHTTILRDRTVTDGFHGLQVDADGGYLRIVFLWRQSPTRYAIRIPLPEVPSESPWTGLPVDSPQEWASEVAFLLMEELDTGFVRRARRIAGEGYVELEYPAPWSHGRCPFYVSAVPAGPGAGTWLTDCGLDISSARRAITEHRLVTWLQACENNLRGRDLGQAVVSWVPERHLIARLDTVETTASAPDAVLSALVLAAIHDAADAGATTVVTTITHPVLIGVGFRLTPGGAEWMVATIDAPPIPPT